MKNLEILIETLHSLLCSLPHSDRMEEIKNRKPGTCYYYIEKTLANKLELPDHAYWKEQAETIMETLQTNSASAALSEIYRILDLVEKVNQLPSASRELCVHLLTDFQCAPSQLHSQ